MSGGEFPIKTGNDGEKMMRDFLHLIGWKNISQNESFTCMSGHKHKLAASKGDKESHNIDATFYYDNPLNHNDTDVILCSSKHNQDEYADSSKAYSFLKELAFSLECSNKDLDFLNQFDNSNFKKKVFKGLLFWVSSNREEQSVSMISKISNGLIKDDEEKIDESLGKLRGINFDSVYLVDNKKARFIYSAIKTSQLNYPNSRTQFLFPHTGLNNRTEDLNTYGDIMPIQYINSSLLPIVIEESERVSILLFCDSVYNREFLRKLIWLVHKIGNLVGSIEIYFDDFDVTAHQADVNRVKQQFQNSSLTEKIVIKRINYFEFTTLKEEQRKSFLQVNSGIKKSLLLKSEYNSDELDKILPYGEMIKPVIASSILSDTDLKAFLIRKGIYVGNKEKQSTVPLLSTLLLSPEELDTLKFMLKDKEDKIKSVPRKTELTNSDLQLQNLAGVINSVLIDRPNIIELPPNCSFQKNPLVQIVGEEIVIEYTIEKQNSTKDLITGKQYNSGFIRFRKNGHELDNQIDYTSRETYNYGTKLFKRFETALISENIIQEEFSSIMFNSFDNFNRITFFLKFLNPNGTKYFKDAQLEHISVKPDGSLAEELPFDLESLKDKVNELAISGKELDTVHYFNEEYKKALLMQKVKIKYKFELGLAKGICLVELDFKHVFSTGKDDTELQFNLDIIKSRENRGQNLNKLTQDLNKEFFKFIQKVFTSIETRSHA